MVVVVIWPSTAEVRFRNVPADASDSAEPAGPSITPQASGSYYRAVCDSLSVADLYALPTWAVKRTRKNERWKRKSGRGFHRTFDMDGVMDLFGRGFTCRLGGSRPNKMAE